MEFLFTFLEGIASFVSPCMLPMVPIYVSYFAGSEEKQKGRALLNSIGFVIGFTIVFVVLAVFASSLGAVLSTAIKYVKILFGVLIIVLGLNYIGVFKIPFLNRSATINSDLKNIHFWKAILFGMIFSISWTPCVGAFLSSALLLIAKNQNLLKGILLILVYSLGLGVPFVISAVLIEKLRGTFDFIKKHYHVIQKISGLILVVMGIYVMVS
ncbi:MAG: cytochrome c biogenesis protein CcdA [Clostridia bacterium]|nr:cytochrome c biogenesis protein CcdA [Clostridia bacterium]